MVRLDGFAHLVILLISEQQVQTHPPTFLVLTQGLDHVAAEICSRLATEAPEQNKQQYEGTNPSEPRKLIFREIIYFGFKKQKNMN